MADRSIPDARPDPRLVGAYRAGVAARVAGQPSVVCPYREGADGRRLAWLRGWLDQRRVELYGDS